jgi:hypothetical protein
MARSSFFFELRSRLESHIAGADFDYVLENGARFSCVFSNDWKWRVIQPLSLSSLTILI